MGPLVHRAEIDSGRQMACQTKARPISPTGAVRIDEVGPPGLLQHHSERVAFKLFVTYSVLGSLHNVSVITLARIKVR